MIVPHGAHGQPISLKIPATWIYAAVSALVFSLILVGSSVVYSTLISRRLVHYADTLSKNQEQQKVILSFSAETRKVIKEIDELVEKDNELRKLLGLKGWQSKIKLSTQGSNEIRTDKISNVLDLASVKLAEKRQSLEELKKWVAVVRSRFANTPSRWPIYGRIVSGFAYRAYPWRGFHYGIDIKASYGAPARATANGVISYVGWRRGYGKLVEIDHGYGVKTIYAHNSAYAAAIGQRAAKGQIVSYVGMTGWTTGPHLHYEVRRYDRPLNPVAYLDLNVLSASRLWR